jgi:uncharacterized RDD family membrane protein YckC
MLENAAASGSWVRGGFWRRAFAFLIDVMLVSAVIALIGVPFYGPTDGAIRVSNTVIHATSCTAIAPPTGSTFDCPQISMPRQQRFA